MPSFNTASSFANPTRRGGLLAALYERITGQPYITVGGCASRDFGPTPGAEIAAVFDIDGFSDDYLMRHQERLLDEARQITAALKAHQAALETARAELQR